jgi:CMP-N,N'-diacetyllegionaminic acid synthase
LEILITICARGGSKGLPGKNIKLLNGRPLISLSIDIAKAFAREHSSDIALSTDSIEIKHVAEEDGLYTNYIRPARLATDQAGKVEAILDVLLYEENRRKCKYDFVLDLDVTSPLRNLEDLTNAFKIIRNDANALNLFSVNPANRNPYFNMVEQMPNGYYGLVKEAKFLTRQSSPKVFDLNASFYFYRRHFFDIEKTVINDRSLIFEMSHICFDIDHSLDFEFAEYLIVHNKLDFQL